MAELAVVAGAAITVPGIVQTASAVLRTAYNLYGSVQARRRQIRVLLEQCTRLHKKIEHHLSTNRGAEQSENVLQGASELLLSCEEVKAVTEDLCKRGFLWCLINQDKIDDRINDTALRISNAFDSFHFVAQIQGDNLQHKVILAQKEDREEFVTRLDQLSASDQQILNAIQDQNKRLEDIMIAVLKRVQAEPADQRPTAERKFLTHAGSVLERMSSGRPQDVSEVWVVSSYDVDYKETGLIGSGSFGEVFKALWAGIRVAIKRMHKEDSRMLTEDDRMSLSREVKIWAGLRHPNVVDFYGACMQPDRPMIIMQYCCSGNLPEYLRTRTTMPIGDRLDLCYDIVSGLNYLHTRAVVVVHADLKGANVMIDDRGIARLADFGLSLAIETIRSKSSIRTQKKSRGTLKWMAPECIDGERVTTASDVYSLGLTMWEVFSQEVPFFNYSDRILPRMVIDKQERPARPDRLGSRDAIWELFQKCWAAEATSRPSAKSVQEALGPYTSRLGSLKA